VATPDAFYVRLHSLSKDVRFVVMKEIAALPTVGALLHDVGSNNLPLDLAEELVRQYTLEDAETEKRRGKIMFALLNHGTQERLCRLPAYQYERLRRALHWRNGTVAPFNEICTILFRCNMDVSILGSTESARAALYYLLKYLTKDATQVESDPSRSTYSSAVVASSAKNPSSASSKRPKERGSTPPARAATPSCSSPMPTSTTRVASWQSGECAQVSPSSPMSRCASRP